MLEGRVSGRLRGGFAAVAATCGGLSLSIIVLRFGGFVAAVCHYQQTGEYGDSDVHSLALRALCPTEFTNRRVSDAGAQRGGGGARS